MQSGRLKPFPTRCPDRRDILACGPVSGHELAEAQVPVLIPGPPALRDALCGQIEHPAQGIIAGEAGLIFRDLAKLAVQALDHVGRVYGLPNLWRIFIENAQNFPVYLILNLSGICA